MAVPEPMQTEFGIHYRLESCATIKSTWYTSLHIVHWWAPNCYDCMSLQCLQALRGTEMGTRFEKSNIFLHNLFATPCTSLRFTFFHRMLGKHISSQLSSQSSYLFFFHKGFCSKRIVEGNLERSSTPEMYSFLGKIFLQQPSWILIHRRPFFRTCHISSQATARFQRHTLQNSSVCYFFDCHFSMPLVFHIVQNIQFNEQCFIHWPEHNAHLQHMGLKIAAHIGFFYPKIWMQNQDFVFGMRKKATMIVIVILNHLTMSLRVEWWAPKCPLNKKKQSCSTRVNRLHMPFYYYYQVLLGRNKCRLCK